MTRKIEWQANDRSGWAGGDALVVSAEAQEGRNEARLTLSCVGAPEPFSAHVSKSELAILGRLLLAVSGES